MAIYTKKNSERIICSTIQIAPDCYSGSKVIKFRASVEKPRVFYLMELIEDDPGEITRTVQEILHPERAIKPLWEVERDAILNALALLGGDKVSAADVLGIGKTTLYRKLAEYAPVHPLYLQMKEVVKAGGSADDAQEEDKEA